MLQPKHLLMKRGALLDQEPREDRKVLAAIGSPDFDAVISVVFSAGGPVTVSDFETVFLCPLSSAAARQPGHPPVRQYGVSASYTARTLSSF